MPLTKIIKQLLLAVTCASALTLAACEPSSSSSASDTSSTEPSTSLSSSSSEITSSSSESSSSSEGSTSEVAVDVQTVVMHYHGESLNYTEWCFWIWEESGDGAIFQFTGTDEYGAYGSYPADTWTTRTKLSFIIRKKITWDGQTSDRSFNYSDYPLTENGEIHIYILEGESELFTTSQDALGNRVTSASFTTWTTIKVETTAAFATYELTVDGVTTKTGVGGSSPQTITLDSPADLSKLYSVRVKFLETDTKWKLRAVTSNNLYDTTEFTNNYVYNGTDLGATYTSESTTFKLWAPTCSAVTLRLYTIGTPSSVSGNTLNDAFTAHLMAHGDQGVWSTTILGDLNMKYYTYMVTNALGTNEVVDPYAKAAGVNGLRGQVLDFDLTNPEGWDTVSYSDIASPTDLTVYEMHVRDLTSDVSWTGTEANRGKYLGLSETGTTYTEGETTVSTGFDHLKELGVNAVQILPFFDSANNELNPSYNWGYNPLNYNVLDGSYSSNPRKGDVRVKEFKQVVKDYASSDIRIIMDVVYNHVSAATSSNFSMIVPGYYFRYNADGSYSNGSGCGNEVASERAMARKFIVDSVVWWASEYNIKGYRFDLMGLIDTTTMNAVKTALAAIDPDIVVYGEPWAAAGTTLPGGQMSTTGQVYSTLVGVGGFNDAGRNGIRGENSWSGNQWGWMQKGEADNASNVSFINRVKGMMAGMNGEYYNYANWNPSKTVNYASCHDNLTLYDQLSGTVDAADIAKASVAINSLVLLSEGIPFINGGEEILRSKVAAEEDTSDTYYTIGTQHISHNSYKSGDATNSYKWGNKITYKAVFDKYKEAIALRKAHAGFRLSSQTMIATKENATGKSMGFWDGDLAYSTIAAWYTGGGETIYVFANARNVVTTGTLRSLITFGGTVNVIYDSTGTRTVGSAITDYVTLSAYSVLVVKRNA